MRIFEVVLGTNDFQSLVPEDPGVWETDRLTMDCRPKAAHWVPPEVRIDNPVLKRGHFLRLTSGAFVITEEASGVVRTQLDMVGELLPIEWSGGQGWDGGKGFLLNVLQCSNCLDHEKTDWHVSPKTGKRITPRTLVFSPKHVPESTLFKIPEKLATIFAVEGLMDPRDEFKYLVESNGLEGLRFKLVWDEHRS